MTRFLAAAALLLVTATAAAEERGAFCELTPCIPGPVSRRVLDRDEKAGGLTCKKGEELGVDAKQHLVFCTTARRADVDGLPIAANAYTLWHPNGRIYQTHLRASVEVTLADHATVWCGADLIALADDGALTYCTLAKPRTSTPRARVGEGISFSPGGRIASLTLDEPYEAAGLDLPAGATIAWDRSGALTGGYLREPLQTATLSIHNDFSLYPGGALHEVELAAPAKIQGHDFPANAKLAVREDGSIEHARYIVKEGVMPHGERWTDTLDAFYDVNGIETTSSTDHWQSTARPTKFDH